jgi:hypothetical protein
MNGPPKRGTGRQLGDIGSGILSDKSLHFDTSVIRRWAP